MPQVSTKDDRLAWNEHVKDLSVLHHVCALCLCNQHKPYTLTNDATFNKTCALLSQTHMTGYHARGTLLKKAAVLLAAVCIPLLSRGLFEMMARRMAALGAGAATLPARDAGAP